MLVASKSLTDAESRAFAASGSATAMEVKAVPP
jgi:hypothetical protein